MSPGDTVWASWGVVAGGDLAELQTNADAAIAKAMAVGWIGTTGVNGPTAEIPAQYGLSQNYPNPFNPVTRISYALPEEATVTLRVYDVLGQEVITLENSVRQAGLHEVTWSGRNALGQSLGSGVYFYRLEATGASGETFANLKKMLYLK
jgi:flagellar hook assembly protein FlgD